MSDTFCTHKVPTPPEGFKWSDEPPSCPYCHIAELEAMLANRQEMALADSTRIAELETENASLRGRFAAEKKQSYLEGVNAGLERAAEIVLVITAVT